MEAYEVRVYGWPTLESNRGPLIKTETIHAVDYWNAQEISYKIWRNTPTGISYKMERKPL